MALLSEGFSWWPRSFISRNTPSRCIFFFSALRAWSTLLSRTRTCTGTLLRSWADKVVHPNTNASSCEGAHGNCPKSLDIFNEARRRNDFCHAPMREDRLPIPREGEKMISLAYDFDQGMHYGRSGRLQTAGSSR